MAGRKQNYGVKAHVQRSFFFCTFFFGGLSTSLEGWFVFWIFEMYCVIFGWLIITIMFSNPEYAVQIDCMVKSKHM